MRKAPDTVSQKQQNLRVQIRRRQIDQLFRLCRHQLQELSVEQSLIQCRNNMKEVQSILNSEYSPQNYCSRNDKNSHTDSDNSQAEKGYSFSETASSTGLARSDNENLQLLLKQLRDINCLHTCPQFFAEHANEVLIMRLHNWKGLDRICQQFCLQMILNMSAYVQESKVSPKKQCQAPRMPPIAGSLNIHSIFCSNNRHCITLVLQILSNLILRDSSSKTIYDLITKKKIYKHILQFLVDKQRRQIYDVIGIEDTFLWFVNKVLSSTIRYHFGGIESDFQNVSEAFYREVAYQMELMCEKKGYQTNSLEQTRMNRINNLLIYLKTLIKTAAVEPEQYLIEKIDNCLFSEKNIFYIDYIGTLTFHTLYALQRDRLKSFLHFILTEPESKQSANILRCIANSLTNDSTNWRIVLQFFVKYSESLLKDQNNLNECNKNRESQDQFQPEGQNEGHGKSPSFLYYFLYFLNDSKTESDMAQIIKIIVCGQGGLGIFEEGLEEIAKSDILREGLTSFGFEI